MIKAPSGRLFNVAAEHIVEFGQSQASVCLWWNINSNNNDRLNLAGQIEWAADNVLDEASRNAMGWRYSWGLTISCWSWSTLHRLWFYRPRLFCPSVKQKSYQTALQRCPGPRAWAMFQSNKGQSLMSHWKRSLGLRSSILFTKDWTLLSRILGRGGLWALSLSLLRIPTRFLWCFLIRRLRGLFRWPLFSSVFRRISNGHVGFVDKVSWSRLV